jgi:hypothetical protein
MRVFLCNLMAVVVLVPALLGWCCRPSTPGTACECECTETNHVHHACCDDSDHAADEHSQTPAKPHFDCKGICSYVLTSKSQVDRPVQMHTLHILTTGLVLAAGQDSAAFSFADHQALSGASSPPLRIHAVNQIWLI